MFIKIDAKFSPLSKQRKFNQCYFHKEFFLSWSTILILFCVISANIVSFIVNGYVYRYVIE
jgi:type IV secretory pathway TrbL component